MLSMVSEEFSRETFTLKISSEGSGYSQDVSSDKRSKSNADGGGLVGR